VVGADPLVGRGPALAALTGATVAAADRRPSLVLVAGEPGIGKTALLSEAARRAGADGALVLWGQCWDGDGAPAYWPWVQVVRSALHGRPSHDVPDLARLLSPSGPDHVMPAEPSTARFELFDGVVRLLTGLTDRAPVVVVLDDLQWADEASLALLEFIARHLHNAAVLLLGAYRDLDAPPGLRRLAGLAEILPLAGLDRDGVSAVMSQVTGTDPTDDLTTRVYKRTGGNPLFVRELTRLLMTQPETPVADRPLPAVLDSVRETLRHRLAHLSRTCVQMLSAAAVAGPQVRPEVLRHLLPSPDDLAAHLAEAVTARVLIAPQAPIGVYQFSHDLYREALYASLTPAERARLHTACGHALDTLAAAGVPVRATEVASHFVAACANDASAAVTAAAVDWSRRAAREAIAQFAADDARQHYQRALRVLDNAAAGDETDRVGVLLGLADAHNRAGDAPAARAVYRQAAQLARQQPDPRALAAAAVGLHALGAPRGQSHAEPIALLQEASAALSATDGPQLALVLASTADDLYHSWEDDHLTRATALAEQAVAMARGQGDPVLLARCLLALHDTGWRPGSARHRLSILEEIFDLAAGSGDQQLHTQALLLRATARLELGDPRGHEDLTEHWHTVEQSGHARGRWQALSRHATSALIAADIATARTLSRQAAHLGESIGEPDWSNVADSQLWEILRFTNERRQYQHIGHNRDIIAGWPPWQALGLADDGELDEARELLAGFDIDRSFRPGPRTRPEPASMAVVSEAVAAAGTRKQREEMYRRLTPLARLHVISGGCAAYSGAFDHYLGLLAASLEDANQAHIHFATAVAMHQRLGAPAWLALSHRHLDRLAITGAGHDPNRPILQSEGDTWNLKYAGRQVHLADLKGLHDLATLIAHPGQPVHVAQLLTGQPTAPAPGADPILDEQAKAAYRRRLTQLDTEIDTADEHRAQQARLERQALIHELSAAAGLGGRSRRLGDNTERARKTVTSRIRDTINRIQRHHPELAQHLDHTITTGTWCCYTPTGAPTF